MAMGLTGKHDRTVEICIQNSDTDAKKQRLLTALEAAIADASGPRSPPPFNSPLSLLPSSSSVTDTAPGPFFFFSLARIDDSLSGNGGISSKTVALV